MNLHCTYLTIWPIGSSSVPLRFRRYVLGLHKSTLSALDQFSLWSTTGLGSRRLWVCEADQANLPRMQCQADCHLCNSCPGFIEISNISHNNIDICGMESTFLSHFTFNVLDQLTSRYMRQRSAFRMFAISYHKYALRNHRDDCSSQSRKDTTSFFFYS